MPVPWMHAFVDVPAEAAGLARSFWSAVSGWPADDGWPGHPEFRSLEPPDGAAYLHVQTIDGPSRVHLDVVGDPDADGARLVRLGATRVRRERWWQVMRSPGGLPFCVCDEPDPHRRPAARSWPDGHRSRPVQLCLDVPGPLFDVELEFWRAATGWADEDAGRPDGHRLVHRAHSPLQLLVRRPAPDDAGTAVRAHLDLGTDDVDAEVARVTALGAAVLRPGDGHVTMRDPAGLAFRVTADDPDR